MKNKNIIINKIALVILLIAFNTMLQASPIVFLKIKEFSVVGKTIEFNVDLKNEGKENLLLDAVALGININSSFLNGGTITFDYILDSRTTSMEALGEYTLDTRQRLSLTQLLLVHKTPGYFKASEIKAGESVSLGRFRVTNSKNWNKNVENPFSFQLESSNAYYGTKILAYVGLDGTATKVYATNNNLRSEVDVFALQGENAISEKNLSFSIYPNPANSIIHSNIISKNAGFAKFEIKSLDGKVISNSTIILNEGLNVSNLDVSAMAAGTYVIELSTNESKSQQLIVLSR